MTDKGRAKKDPAPAEERVTREIYTPSRLRGRRKLTRREAAALFIPALAVLAAVAVALIVLERGSMYKFRQDGTRYYAGMSARMPRGAVLRLDREGLPLPEKKGDGGGSELPVYIDGARKAVLPADMLYYAPRSNFYGRLAGLSEVECDENGTVTVVREGKSVNPEQGFIYDGKDFYLFLEPVTVRFNGYTVDLPALSYAEAVYGGHMMLFDYGTKEFMMEMSDGTGTAGPPSGDYVISLLGDSLTMHDGRRTLLATRPDLFDPVV